MNDTPQIESVVLQSVPLSDPRPQLRQVRLPETVIAAVETYHARMKEAELNRLQQLYTEGKLTDEQIMTLIDRKIIEPNILDIIKIQGMEALIKMALDFIKNNLRTTITGIVFVLTELFTKWGIGVPAGFSDALYTSAYIFIFLQADRKPSLALVAGTVLMLLSFFTTPILAAIGLGGSPILVAGAQMFFQTVVGFLLKDQPDLLKHVKRDAAPVAATLVVLFVLPYSFRYESYVSKNATGLPLVQRSVSSTNYQPLSIIRTGRGITVSGHSRNV